MRQAIKASLEGTPETHPVFARLGILDDAINNGITVGMGDLNGEELIALKILKEERTNVQTLKRDREQRMQAGRAAVRPTTF